MLADRMPADRMAGIGPGISLTDLVDAGRALMGADTVLVSTDTDLTHRAAAGDREAFEQVFADCLPAIWAFAGRRTSGRAAAESLTSRILRRAFAELDDYDGQVPFAAWLLSVAHRVSSAQAPHPARPSGPPHRTHHA
jgi:hypothetical protein